MSLRIKQEILPDLSSMKYEIIDLVGEEYLDDSIQQCKYKERQSSAFEDFQKIDAEIIDYGVCEDDYEETSLFSKSPSKLQNKLSIKSSNLSKLNDFKLKCLCIKVVDCDKYPWYYKKYKKQIQERKYFNAVKDATNIVKCQKKSISESMNTENNVDKDGTVREDTFKMSPYVNKSLCDKREIMKANSMLQLQFEKEKGLNKVDLKEIDFKKNKGLVGMKIKRIVKDDKTKEKSAIKKESEKCKEQSKIVENPHPSKLLQKTVQFKTSESLGSTIIPGFVEIQKTNTLEIKKDQNKLNSENAPISKNLEKNIALKCSLKMSSLKSCEDLTKTNHIKHEEYLQKENKHHHNPQNKDGRKREEIISKPTETKISHLAECLTRIQSQCTDSEKLCSDQKEVSKDHNGKKMTRYKPMPKSKRTEIEKQKNIEAEKNQNTKKKTTMDTEKSQISAELKNTISANTHYASNIVKPKSAINPKIKNCESSNTSFKYINKFTKKVLKIVEKSPKMGNKTYNKDTIKKKSAESLTTNQESHEQKKIEPKEVISTPIMSSVFVEAAKPTELDTNNKNDFRPGDILIRNKNRLQTPNKDIIKKKSAENLTTNQESSEQNKIEHKETIFTPIMSSFEVAKPTELDKNNKNIVRPGDMLIRNKNELKTPNKKQFNVSKIMHNETISNDIYRYVSELAQNQNIETSTNLNSTSATLIEPDSNKLVNDSSTTVRPTIVINTEDSLSKPLTGISKQPQKTAPFEEMSSRRKQSVKLKNVGDIENYMNVNQINRTTGVLTSQSPKTQKNESSLPNTSSHKKSANSAGMGSMEMSTIITLNTNTPQNAQIPAIVIRSNQTPNTIMTNVTSVPMSTQPYLSSPDLRTNTFRPPLSQPLPNPPQGPRHHFSLKHVRPWRRNAYQQPNNYPRPPIHGYPPRMPLNTNFHQDRSNHMQNNYMQQPLDARQRFQMTLGNAHMPPGICNVFPDNVYRPYNYPTYSTPPPPLPKQLRPPPRAPQPSFLQNNFNQTNNSVIGENSSGFVKKISIATPSTNISCNEIKKEENIKVENKATPTININSSVPAIPLTNVSCNEIKKGENIKVENKATPTISIDSSMPVLSKLEMMKELEKAMPIQSPAKTNLKRPLTYEQSTRQTADLKKRPGPLIKELEKVMPLQSPAKTDLKRPLTYEQSTRQTTDLKKRPGPLIKELEKSMPIQSPAKTDLKRPLTYEQTTRQATDLKNTPGPLSKKLKVNSDPAIPLCNRKQIIPCKGYSPPILPIPTYQNILSEVQSSEKPLHYLDPSQQTNKGCVKNIPKNKSGQTKRSNHDKEENLKIYLKKDKKRSMKLC